VGLLATLMLGEPQSGAAELSVEDSDGLLRVVASGMGPFSVTVNVARPGLLQISLMRTTGLAATRTASVIDQKAEFTDIPEGLWKISLASRDITSVLSSIPLPSAHCDGLTGAGCAATTR
jgi:hypothetical protein